jgi:RND family efflux transporter MFP subunit
MKKLPSLTKTHLAIFSVVAVAMVGFGIYAKSNSLWSLIGSARPLPTASVKTEKIAASPNSLSMITTANNLAPAVVAAVAPPKAIEIKSSEAKSDALGCLIEPSLVVDLTGPGSGRLDQVQVERGDLVTKGQLLASLESKVERASVALALERFNNDAEIRSAQTNEEFARRKHERSESLHRDGVVSVQAREQAESESRLATERLKQSREQHAVAAQEVQLARAQLSMKSVLSPISGLVIERYFSAGERADEKPIFKLAQIDPLRIEAILPATLYGKVSKGMSAKVQPELAGASARTAKVLLVDRVIDPASNTFRVRLELPNSDYALPSGVRCKVNLNPITDAPQT